MKKLLLVLALLLAPSLAFAQCNGVFPANTVCGSVAGGIPGPASPSGFSASTGLIVGTTTVAAGTNTRVLYDNAGLLGEYTNTQLTTLIDPFTSSLSGAVPASGGGGSNFLRADGSWATPPGGTITIGVSTVTGASSTGVLFNNSGVVGSNAGLTYTPAGALTIAPTATSLTQGLNITQSGPASGSTVGPQSFNLITLTDGGNTLTGGRDAFDLLGTVSSGLRVNDTVSSATGVIRIGGTFAVNFTGAGATAETVGVIGSSYSNGSPGALWGTIGYSSVGASGAVSALIPVAAEVSAQTGSTVTKRVGFLAITEAPVQGSSIDAAFVVTAEDTGHGTPGGFKNVITISNNFFSSTAMDSTANFFNADSATLITNWANMSNVTVTGTIMLFPNLYIPGAAAGFTLPAHVANAFQYGATNSSAVQIEIDAFTGSALFVGKRADTSSTAPSAVQSGETITGLSAQPYDGTAYAEIGGIGIHASQNLTNAAHGSYISFLTTPINTTVIAEVARFDNGGNLGIGNVTPKATLDINKNTSSSPAVILSSSLLKLQSADTLNNSFEFTSYGAGTSGGNIMAGGVAAGTSASPTGTATGQYMFNMRGYGYNSGWQLGAIYILQSAEAWSAGHQGTLHQWWTTPIASTTITQAMQLQASGGLAIGALTDLGAGTLLANRGVSTVPTTVSGLLTCDGTTEGMRSYVTDQNTAVSYRGAVTGSGSTRQAVLCSNSAWIQD